MYCMTLEFHTNYSQSTCLTVNATGGTVGFSGGVVTLIKVSVICSAQLSVGQEQQPNKSIMIPSVNCLRITPGREMSTAALRAFDLKFSSVWRISNANVINSWCCCIVRGRGGRTSPFHRVQTNQCQVKDSKMTEGEDNHPVCLSLVGWLALMSSLSHIHPQEAVVPAGLRPQQWPEEEIVMY